MYRWSKGALMRRYWFEFVYEGYEDIPFGLRMGCGVTASTQDEALGLIKERVFEGRELPPILRVVSDVDISTLDEGHVRPNMGIPVVRGIWFPLGY
jgi:hypothetical protein